MSVCRNSIIVFTCLELQVAEEEGEDGGIQVFDVTVRVDAMLLTRVSLN